MRLVRTVRKATTSFTVALECATPYVPDVSAGFGTEAVVETIGAGGGAAEVVVVAVAVWAAGVVWVARLAACLLTGASGGPMCTEV